MTHRSFPHSYSPIPPFNMRHALPLLLLLLPWHPALRAQDMAYAALTIPQRLQDNAKSVVRQHEKVYTVHSDEEATLYERIVVTLLKDGHDDANRLVVYYDDESKITRFKATLYDALGQKIRHARRSEIEDVMAISSGQFYTDSRVKTTVLDHLSYPFTVEFEYEKSLRGSGMFKFPHWLPVSYDQSLQQASFTAIVPDDNTLHYHANKLPDPTVTQEDGNTIHRWTLADQPAVLREPDAPSLTTTMPYLRTTLARFHTGDYPGSMDDWQAFGVFMQQLIAGRDVLPPELAELVRTTTAGLTTDREKIDALYRLLQERTRYVGVQLGIGGFQPFSATYVEENRYGDCKALSNYLGAMLKSVDIESYPVLIDWNDRQFFSVANDFATSAFNHMVLYVPGEDMYLECTSNVAPPGYLGEEKEDRNVLWVTPEGGKLARTHKPRPSDHAALRTVRLELAADGSADFAMTGRYDGGVQESIRYFLRSEQEEKKRLEALERAGWLPDVGGRFTVDCRADEPVTTITYATELPDYARRMGKRLFLPVNKFNAYDNVPDKLTERKLPISRVQTRFYVDTVHITLPAELEVESKGEAVVEFTHAAGKYRAELSTSDNTLTWVRTLTLLPAELPAEAYADYRGFFADVAKADKRKIVLRERRSR